MKMAGGLIGLGVLIAIVGRLQGVVALLALLLLAYGVVCAILVWRGIEVVSRRRMGARGVS